MHPGADCAYFPLFSMTLNGRQCFGWLRIEKYRILIFSSFYLCVVRYEFREIGRTIGAVFLGRTANTEGVEWDLYRSVIAFQSHRHGPQDRWNMRRGRRHTAVDVGPQKDGRGHIMRHDVQRIQTTYLRIHARCSRCRARRSHAISHSRTHRSRRSSVLKTSRALYKYGKLKKKKNRRQQQYYVHKHAVYWSNARVYVSLYRYILLYACLSIPEGVADDDRDVVYARRLLNRPRESPPARSTCRFLGRRVV